MPAALDDLMETASQALAEMNYARCEALCLDALDQACANEDWIMVQRVLLPLQETRRQKRQAAIDGPILLGTNDRIDEVETFIEDRTVGCVVLTRPCNEDDAIALTEFTRHRGLAFEVLFANNTADSGEWRISSSNWPQLWVSVPAPNQAWRGEWVNPLHISPPTPAHWFMHASEELGNAAIQAIPMAQQSSDYFASLVSALHAIGNHEILHQRLAAAAKALQEAKR